MMKRLVIAAALLGAFITPVLALTEGSYFVGFNTRTHTCSVVRHMSAHMKMMGRYHSRAAAETAMHGMKECRG
jgi:hypothetical protein